MSEGRDIRSGDVGSIAPLGIGLALMSLSVILVFSSVSTIFLMQRRLTTLAEFAALSGARYNLSAREFVRESSASPVAGLRIADDSILDGVTRQVTICGTWQAPLPAFVSLLDFDICGSGAARAG